MNLVTGATGHIGNVLVRMLLAQGKKVRVLVLPGEDCTPINNLPVEKIEGDVLNPGSLQDAFEGIKYVFHLAGLISIMPGKNPQVGQVNLQGTRNILQAGQQVGIRRLVYTSSIHALSRAPHGVTIDESIPFDPEHAISEYDRSKAEASLEVQKAACQGLDAVIACPTGVIGPYDFRRSEMGQVILDAMANKPQFYVDGSYDFVDVRDVADGLIRSCEKGQKGESYILSGERVEVRGIMDMARRAMGVQAALLRIPMSIARFISNFTPAYYRLARSRPRITPYSLATVTSNSVISNAKAQRELGFSPRPLHESIADTVRWFCENRNIWTHFRISGL